jgi:hypothetical protein
VKVATVLTGTTKGPDALNGRGTVAGSVDGKVRQDPPSAKSQVNRRKVAVLVAMLVAVLALARCGGDVVALGRTDVANSDQTFRNGSFLITVTGLAYGVKEIDVSAAAKSGGASAYKPKNGQFIVFYAKATRIGFGRASMPSTSSTLSDATGKKYTAAGPYPGALGQGFDESQLPGTTHSGWFVFDVPESLTMPKTLNVQSDPHPGTTNPPTLVRFG